MKKIVALLMAIIMVIGMLPTMAFADDQEPQTPVTVYVGEKPKESPDEYYLSLKEAIEGKEDSPKIIQLMRNDNRTFDGAGASYITIDEGEDITIDLNGYTAWYVKTAGENDNAVIVNDGTLTVMDSKDVYAKGTFGKLGCGPDGTVEGVPSTLIVNNGILTVRSGLLDNQSTKDTIASAGTVTVKGGKVNAAAGSAISMTKGTVTVEGGTVCGTANGILMTYTANDANVTISGGTISGEKSLAYTTAQDTAAVTRKVTISGGLFTEDVAIGCNAEISDGIFKGAVDAGSLTGFITGGTYTNQNTSTYIDDEYCEIILTAGGYEVVECYAEIGSYSGETWTASSRYPSINAAMEAAKTAGEAQTVKLTRSTNESATIPEKVTFIVPNTLTYSGKVSALPDGFLVKVNYEADGTHYSLRTEGQNITTELVGEAATALLNNDNVENFSGVNINKALKDGSYAKNENQRLAVKLTGIGTSVTFAVEPQYRNGDNWTVIANDQIEGKITFRLPVSSETGAKVAAVYHEDAFMDFYPIQGNETDGKYLELSAKEFSTYRYEVLTGVSAGDKLVIKHSDGSFAGYEQLITTGEDESEVLGAVSEWADTDTELILMKDYTIGTGENFANQEITLNLNGYKLTGEAKNAANVTVTNSGADQTTLAAVGTYANNVSAFAADGYDTKNDGKELFLSDNDIYTVVVDAQPTGSTADRDLTTTTHKWKVEGIETPFEEEADALEAAGAGNEDKVQKLAWLDIFAGDKIKVTVKVEGARFAAANVTFTFDPTKFKVSAPKTGWQSVQNSSGTTVGYRFYDYKTGGGYFENGEVLGTFTATALESGAAQMNQMFKVSEYKTYVAKAWADGWSSGAANELKKSQLKDDCVNIILKQMSVTVTAEEGLSYKDAPQALLKTNYTVKDNLTTNPITETTIKYAVMTKKEVEGTAFVDENGDGFDDVYTNKQESETNPGYVTGMEPKVPAEADYGNSMERTDADDYVVFWKVTKDGYDPVTGQENVSIAPLDVTLDWFMPKDINTESPIRTISLVTSKTALNDGITFVNRNLTPEDVAEGVIRTDYLGYYSRAGFHFNDETEDRMKATVSVYNSLKDATITMTEKPDTAGENELKVVGTYKFTADLDSNYHILNPEITVLIDGAKIEGFNFAKNPDVFYDGLDHVAGTLTDADAEGVKVEFRYSKDRGENWTPWEEDDGEGAREIPVLTDANAVPYIVEMRLSAEGSYTRVDPINFSIKPVLYYTEKNDYVTGWDLVLCYTNEEVPSFNYDGKQMFDVTAFGYTLGSAWADESGKTQTVEGTAYAHVYGIVVEGNADVNLVLPSNTPLYTGVNQGDDHVDHMITLTTADLKDANENNIRRMDVNKSGTIDINDLVAVAATYNVDRSYLESEEEATIAIVLRADVNGNKVVNTYDCSLIMTNTKIEQN